MQCSLCSSRENFFMYQINKNNILLLQICWVNFLGRIVRRSDKSGKTGKVRKKRQKSGKIGVLKKSQKKSGCLTIVEKTSDFVFVNLQIPYFTKPSNGKKNFIRSQTKVKKNFLEIYKINNFSVPLSGKK